MKSSESNSEWLTRKRIIDPKLKAAGWDIVPFSNEMSLKSHSRSAITEFETANGPADYALCVDGQILGIVEAKKLTLGPQSVLTQAERYCKGIADSPFNYREFQVPYLYSTNGEIIWHHDIRHELCRSHIVTQFHTPDALIERLQHHSTVGAQLQFLDKGKAVYVAREQGGLVNTLSVNSLLNLATTLTTVPQL